ncbi:MAG: pyridoxal phosphate-dependent aminotransferase [Acidimicrobiaceae bacterium]|nr:pyridoxal phosphate-dependent aminotransferase [Acidimicrobiaceae bacterium]
MSTNSVVRISSRISQVPESATLAIDSKAKALKAQGVDVIGYGAGEPDFPTPEFIVEAAVRAARDPKYHRYSPTAGLPELRQAIADKTMRDAGLEVRPDQVIVTNGGKHAIFNALMTLVGEGDEVIIPTPCWTTYPEVVKLAGATPIYIKSDISNGFKVTEEQLEAVITERTRLFLHVSPSNPTGAVYDFDQTVRVGRMLAERNVVVLTDEIYEHLTYDDNKAFSMPVAVPELEDRWVIVNGVAKTYSMTGWRVGWMIGSGPVIKAASNLQSQVTSNVNNIAQVAATAALNGGLEDVAAMRSAFDRRRRKIVVMLNEISGVNCLMPEGAFYAYPDMSSLVGRNFSGVTPRSTSELAEVILDQAKVAIVPGEAFLSPGFCRLSYALSDDDLVEGIERIGKLVTSTE